MIALRGETQEWQIVVYVSIPYHIIIELPLDTIVWDSNKTVDE